MHELAQFLYFTYSQNIQINLLLQSTAMVTKYNKELLITIIIHLDCKRDKIKTDWLQLKAKKTKTETRDIWIGEYGNEHTNMVC